jgi:hypothetical protein
MHKQATSSDKLETLKNRSVCYVPGLALLIERVSFFKTWRMRIHVPLLSLLLLLEVACNDDFYMS